MVDIIVHIGRPKTGTTAIQNFLTKNKMALLQQGVLYPHIGRFSENSNNHLTFFLSMCKRLDLLRTPVSTPELSPSVYTTLLKAEIDALEAHTVILSAEALFTPAFDRASLEHIRNELSFGRIKILGLLRKQSDILESSFGQLVTGPQRFYGSPRAHLNNQKALGTFDYEGRLATFEDVFGKESLNIVWYEEVRRDILRPLCGVAGIRESSSLASVSQDNTRTSWFYIFCARMVNRFNLRDYQRAFFLRNSNRLDKIARIVGLQDLMNRSFRPYRSATKQELQEQYGPSNDRIDERYCISMSKKSESI